MGSCESSHRSEEKLSAADFDLDQLIRCHPSTSRRVIWPPSLRVFISSTFDDFQVERRWILKDVLPDALAEASQAGLEIVIVDFRSGLVDTVTEENLTRDLCVEEMSTCMRTSTGVAAICLLGQRHGYVPLPRSIPVKDFASIAALASSTAPATAALLRRLFRLDENAVPPAFVLLNISEVVPAFWSDKAARDTYWEDASQLSEFLQECGAAVAPDLFPLFKRSVTEWEVKTALELRDSSWDSRLAVTVAVRKFTDLPSQVSPVFVSQKGAPQLQQLIKDVSHLNGPFIRHFSVPFPMRDADPYRSDLSAFLRRTFSASISAVTAAMRPYLALDPAAKKLVDELLRHAALTRDAMASYIRRPEIEATLGEWARGASRLLFLTGDRGCGKSVSCTWLASLLQGMGCSVVYRSVGGCAFDAHGLAVSVAQHLRRNCGDAVDSGLAALNLLTLMYDIDKSVRRWPSSNAPLVVLIDGADLVDPSLALLRFFAALAAPARVVLTALPESVAVLLPLHTAAQSQIFDLSTASLGADTALTFICSKAKRTLSQPQRDAFIRAVGDNPLVPLHADSLFRLLNTLRSFDALPHLPLTLPDALDAVLAASARRIGPELFSRLCGFLRTAIAGVSEAELAALFALAKSDRALCAEVFKYNPDEELVEGIPPHVLSRALSLISHVLANVGGGAAALLTFKHSAIADAASRWLERGSASVMVACGEMMRHHFRAFPDSNPRKQCELPHLLAHTPDALVAWLTLPPTFAAFDSSRFHGALLCLPQALRRSCVGQLLHNILALEQCGDSLLIRAALFAHQFSFFEHLPIVLPILAASPSPIAPLVCAIACEATGRFKDAKRFCAKILDAAPDVHVAYMANVLTAFLCEYEKCFDSAYAHVAAAEALVAPIGGLTALEPLLSAVIDLTKAQIQIQTKNFDSACGILMNLVAHCPVAVVTAVAFNSLAQLHELQNRFAAAVAAYESCAALYRTLLGDEDPHLGAVYNGWGLALESLGDGEGALNMFEKSLQNRRMALGDEHLDLAPTLSNLVAAYLCCGREEDAAAMQSWLERILSRTDAAATSAETSEVGSIAAHFAAQSRVARRDIIHLLLRECVEC